MTKEAAMEVKTQSFESEIEALKKTASLSLDSTLAAKEAEITKQWTSKMADIESAHAKLV